jgi:hypothetical protein
MKYIRISPLESQYFWMGRVFVSVDYLGAMSRLAFFLGSYNTDFGF